MGDAQSRLRFKRAVKGPESRQTFLLLPKIVADIWCMGQMDQRCSCCQAISTTVVERRGHTARGSSTLQRWQSGSCCCLGAQLCTGTLPKSILTHSVLAVQKSHLLRVAYQGDLLLRLFFGKRSERHCTTLLILCLGVGLDRQVLGASLRILFHSTPLKDFPVCKNPFSFILLLYLSEEGMQLSKKESRK